MTEIVILLVVLISVMLLVANTAQQIIDELDAQATTDDVNQPGVISTPIVFPTATTVPSGPTAVPTPIKIFG